MSNLNYNQIFELISNQIRTKKDFSIDASYFNGLNIDAHFRREFEYDSNQRSVTHNMFKLLYIDKYGAVYTFKNYFAYTFFMAFGDSKYEIIQHDTPWEFTVHFINH